MKRNQFREKLICLIEDCIDDECLDETGVDEIVSIVYDIRKQCSRCKALLPAHKDYFAAHPRTRDGFQSYCRDCGNLKNEESKAKRKAEEQAQGPIDYVEDPKKVKDYCESPLDVLDYKDKACLSH